MLDQLPNDLTKYLLSVIGFRDVLKLRVDKKWKNKVESWLRDDFESMLFLINLTNISDEFGLYLMMKTKLISRMS